MRRPFHDLFSELSAQHLLTPKEAAFHTGRSGSTVYRWLRAEGTPDIEDFVKLVKSAKPEAQERLLAWLTQELPVSIDVMRLSDQSGSPEQATEPSGQAAKDQTLQVVELLLHLMRWHDSEVGTSDTLTPQQYQALSDQLQDILQRLMSVKQLHSGRVVERRRAKTIGREE